MKRTEVYQLIDGERAYQDGLWGSSENEGHRNPLSIGEFILLLEEYIAKARAQWAVEPKPEHEAMGIIRKVGGIAVNAMEQHGAPARK